MMDEREEVVGRDRAREYLLALIAGISVLKEVRSNLLNTLVLAHRAGKKSVTVTFSLDYAHGLATALDLGCESILLTVQAAPPDVVKDAASQKAAEVLRRHGEEPPGPMGL